MPHTHAARCVRPFVLMPAARVALAGALCLGWCGVGQAWAEDAAQPGARQPRDEAGRVLNTAHGLLGRGMVDLAAAEYEKFLEMAPGHAGARTAHYGLAVCLQRLGRADEAVGHLEPLAGDATFEFAAEVDLLLATCRMSRGEFERAVTALRRMVRAFPQHGSVADARAMLVESLSRLGQHEAAGREARAFAQALPDSPLRERTDVFLALAEMNQGRDEQAQRVLEASLGRFPGGVLADQATLLLAQCRHRRGLLGEAADAYGSLAARVRGPVAGEALLGLGQIALVQGRLDDAARALDTLLREHGDTAPAVAGGLARARVSLEQGDAAAARARLEGLERVVDQTLRDDVAYWLAKCDLRKGRAADAAQRLARAAAEFPESDLSAEIAYDAAIALLRSGDERGAEAALAAFGEAHPRHALSGEALATRAGVLHRLGEYEASRVLCERFVREHGSSARVGEIEFLSCENRYLAGDYARAERAYRQYLERRGAAEGEAGRADAARFRLAMCAYRQNRAAEAEGLLEAVAGQGALRPEFAGALLALGDIRFQRGAWGEAEAVLQRYLDLGPGVASRDDALMKVGLCRARQERHEAAWSAFGELRSVYPDSVHALQARFEQGQSLLALGRDAEARAAMEEVLSAGRETRLGPHALLALGTIARREGRSEEATRLLAEAGRLGGGEIAAEAELQRGEALLSSGDYGGAAEALAGFVQRHPGHTQVRDAQARLVIALARSGKPAAALEALTALGRQATELDAATRQAMVFEAGWSRLALGQRAEARRGFEALLSEEPAAELRSHVLLALGGLAADDGRLADAIPLLERAVDDGRGSGQAEVVERASYRLGACRLEQGEFEAAAEALACFETEFSGSTLRGSALLLRGEALFKGGRVERAAASFQRVIDEHGDGPHAPAALLRLGEATAALQLWVRSEAAFARWLEHPPKDGEGGELWFQARFGLGWARENQGRYDAAMREYEAVVVEHEGATAARAQFQIGQCLFAMGRHDDAVRELLKVDILHAYPEWSAAALYEAGRCLVAAGKAAEARAQFEAVRTRFADTSWATLAGQRLAEVGVGSVPGR